MKIQTFLSILFVSVIFFIALTIKLDRKHELANKQVCTCKEE